MANNLLILKINNTFWHRHNNLPLTDRAISDFQVSIDSNLTIVELDGSTSSQYPITNVSIQVDGGTVETFTNRIALINRLVSLSYTPYIVNSGLTQDQIDAIQSSNAPSETNPFATMNDVIGTKKSLQNTTTGNDTDQDISVVSELPQPFPFVNFKGVYVRKTGLLEIIDFVSSVGNKLKVFATGFRFGVNTPNSLTINASAQTAENTQTFQNASGTIALLSDIVNQNITTVKLAEPINKGQAVYISSANGTNIIVSKASNATEVTSSKTLGLLTATGTTNDIVSVQTFGLLDGLNTSTSTIGDPVWLDTSGDLIFGLASKPHAPAHLVYIGVVSRVHAVNGEIFVNVQNGFELDELHDVLITSPVVGDTLKFDGSLWKNVVENNWVDYSATSTIVGWSSFTTKSIQVLNVNNKYLIVHIYIDGVSNSPSASCTIPNNATSRTDFAGVRCANNGSFATTPAVLYILSGSNNIVFNLNNSGTGFTASGNKILLCQLIVKI